MMDESWKLEILIGTVVEGGLGSEQECKPSLGCCFF